MKVHTTTLTAGNTLVINSVDGAMMVSVQPNTGASCTFNGGITFKGTSSTALTLQNSQVLTVSALSPASPLDGITITAVSGDTDVIIGL